MDVRQAPRNLRKAVLFLLALPVFATAQTPVPPYNPPVTVLDVPEPYTPHVSRGMIIDSLLKADYEHAKVLTDQLIQQKIRESVDDWAKAALRWTVDKLNEIVSDETKTEVQKQDALNFLVDQSLLQYESTPAGPLAATYRYSFDYQLARVFADVIRRKDYCGYKAYADTSGYVSYERFYAIRSPQISIYRVIGANRKLVTAFEGGWMGYSEKWELAPRLQSLKTDWNTYRNMITDDLVTRIAVDIPTGIHLKTGQTLLYEVVAYYAPRKQISDFSCGNEEATKELAFVSSVTVDADADGAPDVIPAETFRALISKVNARAILPAITVLLD